MARELTEPTNVEASAEGSHDGILPALTSFFQKYQVPVGCQIHIIDVFKSAPDYANAIATVTATSSIRYRDDRKAELSALRKFRSRLETGGDDFRQACRNVGITVDQLNSAEAVVLAKQGLLQRMRGNYRRQPGSNNFGLVLAVCRLADIWEVWKLRPANASDSQHRGDRRSDFVVFVESAVQAAGFDTWMPENGGSLGSTIARILSKRRGLSRKAANLKRKHAPYPRVDNRRSRDEKKFLFLGPYKHLSTSGIVWSFAATSGMTIMDGQTAISPITKIGILHRSFDQDASAAFLWDECGVRIAPKTLQKLRSVGGGPNFYKGYGGRVFYEPASLCAWAAATRSPTVASTSELPPRAA